MFRSYWNRVPTGLLSCSANKAAQRGPYGGYPDEVWMDVGNPDYQAKWLANVSSQLKNNGWDGVFVDDTDESLDWHLNGRTVARYPTDAAWRAATRSALASIGPALQSQGFLVVPNVYAPWKANADAVAIWTDWLQFTSGAAQEWAWMAGANNRQPVRRGVDDLKQERDEEIPELGLEKMAVEPLEKWVAVGTREK